MPNTAEQAIYNRLASAPTFHPASAKLLPTDWTLEPGDVVTVKSGGTSYSVPVYSMDLTWNANSQSGTCESATTRIAVESTGGQTREPLPELQRKQFEQDRYAYTNFKEQKQEIDEHWKHVVNVTDQGMSDAFGIIGVSIGQDGMPVKDASGNYVWDDSGTGGEIWGHLNRSAWSTQILNHIKDANGNIISLAEVYTDAYGNALINAINDQRTGTATINANRIHIQSTSGSGIVLDNQGNISINAAETVTRINGQSGSSTVYLSADKIKLDGKVLMGNVQGLGYALTVDNADIGRLFLRGASGNALDCYGRIYVIDSYIQLDSDSYIYGPSASFDDLYVRGGTGFQDGVDVSTAYNAFQFVVDPNNSGHFILQGKTLSDQTNWANAANFNIAATQFYQDGVAAAQNSVAARILSANDNVVSGTLTISSATTLYPAKKVGNTYTKDTDYALTITPSGGTHDIRITASIRGNNRPVTTEIFADAGAYADLHNARAGYYTFKVTCGGTEKWYYFRVGNP